MRYIETESWNFFFETGSNLSSCDPFVSNQQLEPQGFIFKTYIFNCTEKKEMVFFANTPPNMIYLFNYTEYYLEHWLNK